MAEREVVLEKDETPQAQAGALRQATARAEQAEAELARLKKQAGTAEPADAVQTDGAGESELRKDSMMAHLLDSLAAGKDIGHYGRLVFAMVARHFLTDGEVIARLVQDSDFAETEAVAMLRQVEGRDYNPPKRERIMAWQAEQAFPIIPHPEDPDCGNLYRSLTFPDAVYQHIEEYQEKKAAVDSE